VIQCFHSKSKTVNGYPTIIFNFLGGGLAALSAMDVASLGALAPYMPVALAVGNIVLRMFTTTPVGNAQ
jgi:hypothetical protein